MTKILTTQNAQITTATVEVKTLTISGKQVTLSVFRQLREETLIAVDGTLNGVPWGHVNYHHDKCEKDAVQHLHVVWQRGAELLRCRVDLIPSFDRPSSADCGFVSPSADTFYNECVRLEMAGEQVGYFDGRPIRRHLVNHWNHSWEPLFQIEATLDGVPVVMTLTPEVFSAAEEFARLEYYRERLTQAAAENLGNTSSAYLERELAEAERKFSEKMAAVDESPLGVVAPVDDLFLELQAEVAAEAARRRRHRDALAAVKALPHLFIAV